MASRVGRRVLMAAAVTAASAIATMAIANPPGCYINQMYLCSMSYVDPSPVCPDIILTNSWVPWAAGAPEGVYDTEADECEIQVIPRYPDPDDESSPRCLSAAQVAVPLNYITAVGPACP